MASDVSEQRQANRELAERIVTPEFQMRMIQDIAYDVVPEQVAWLLGQPEFRRAVVADVIRAMPATEDEAEEFLQLWMDDGTGERIPMFIGRADLLSALFPGSPDGE